MKLLKEIKKYHKRITSAAMAAVMTVLIPFQPLAVYHVKAAGDKTLYIKEVKLFITKKSEGGKLAAEWCADQKKKGNGDWHCNDEDTETGAESIVRGYESLWKEDSYTYLCYSTTTDPKEAITDLAVMNETGNYSAAAYDQLLDDQKEAYTDLVTSLQGMLVEYKENYENKLPTAVQAHDILNKYIEDDSQMELGDFLINATDEQLVNMLLQANGQIVLLVQNELASACDTNGTTWLDRMSLMGTTLKNPDYEEGGDEPKYLDGYKALYKKAYLATNKNSKKAIKLLDTNYKEGALELIESWDDIKQHIDHCRKFTEENGLDEMSEDEYNEWSEENAGTSDILTYQEERGVINCLAMYEYGGGSLLDYFNREYDEINQNITELYPLVAALTDGQEAGLSSTVSLFSLVNSAINATYLNDYNKGMAKSLDEADVSKADEKDIKETEETINDKVDDWTDEEKISVYEGVDREIYKKGGVAVTSTAETYSNVSPNKWADHFVDGKTLYKVMGGLFAGVVASSIGAYVMNKILKDFTYNMMDDVWFVGNQGKTIYGTKMETLNLCEGTGSFDDFLQRATHGPVNARSNYQEALNDMFDKGLKHENNAMKFNVLRGCKIGLTVFAILLAVADITMTVIALTKYYNRSHLPIPHHMVDLTYEENKDTSYVVYKGVTDQDGNVADIYNDGGKQWLVLYYTKDSDAGDPILAPDGKLNRIIQKTGYSDTVVPRNYSAIHIFGTPNAVQNLTYEDGENGWTYNNEDDGCYVYFNRDPEAYIQADNNESQSGAAAVATVMGSGEWVHTLATGIVFGIVFTMIMTMNIKKRRREENIEE